MTLVKNGRFKRGSNVTVFHSPTYQGYSIKIEDSTATGEFRLKATLETDITGEMINIGDIMAFPFAAGLIVSKGTNYIIASFPDSTFPTADILSYVGSMFQHIMVFSTTDRLIDNLIVNKYNEKVEVATFSEANVVYNRKYNNTLELTEVSIVDEGSLTQLNMSVGYVIKSCDENDYSVNHNEWQGDFPIGLSGGSIDPIYRLGSLDKREMSSRRDRTKAKFKFQMIG